MSDPKHTLNKAHDALNALNAIGGAATFALPIRAALAQLAKTLLRNRHLRDQLAALQKRESARTNAVAELRFIYPEAQRFQHLIDARGKLTQRSQELRTALGLGTGTALPWPELIGHVRKLRAQADESAGKVSSGGA